MALSSWLRSISHRLDFLIKPVPLASTLGLLLLGVFVWEYANHPEWFRGYSQEAAPPSGRVDLPGLTPEEQAAIADIDNLTLLFSELGVESGGIPNIQALPEESPQPPNSNGQNLLSLGQPAGTSGAAVSPFAEYLKQYQFAANRPNPDASVSASDRLTDFRPGAPSNSQPDEASAPTGTFNFTNPLRSALQNQGLQTGSDRVNRGLNQESTEQSRELGNPADGGSTVSREGVTNQTFTGEFGSQAVTIPGVDFPVLPTLPQMSPPPGTTGYTPPATLDLMPPAPGINPPSGMPTSGTSYPSPGSAGVPNLVNPSTPNLTAPQVDVSNGYVTPYTPVIPQTPTPTATPAPFSAPRPPGSYIGGGYINTFSNPAGPSN